MDDICRFLCQDSPDCVGSTGGYESPDLADPYPHSPPLSFRERVLKEVRQAGRFMCRPNERGTWNIRPSYYFPAESGDWGPQLQETREILEALESEGLIVRAQYLGKPSVHLEDVATLYSWRAPTQEEIDRLYEHRKLVKYNVEAIRVLLKRRRRRRRMWGIKRRYVELPARDRFTKAIKQVGLLVDG